MKIKRILLPIILSLGIVSCDATEQNKDVNAISVEITERTRVQGDTFSTDDLFATLHYDDNDTKVVPYSKFGANQIYARCYTPIGKSIVFSDDFELTDYGDYEIELTYYPMSQGRFGCSGSATFSVEEMYVAATSISLNTTSLSINEGATAQLYYSILPSGATTKVPTFSSNDINVANVNESGLITAIGEGQCVITASVDDVKQTCLVTVMPSNTVDYVFTNSSFETENGTWIYSQKGSYFDQRQNRGVCIASETTIYTEDSFNNIVNIQFEFASGSSSIFSYLSTNCGSIETFIGDTSIGKGTISQLNASYRAQYPIEDNLSGQVKLVIKPNEKHDTVIYIKSVSITSSKETIYPTSISLSGSNTLAIGESNKVTVTYDPSTTNVRDVTWSSSNEQILTVGVDGTVYGVAEGSATITATATALEGSVSDSITITVSRISVTAISLGSDSLSIYIGNSKQISVSVTPVNASNKNVTFTSSNPNIATVDTAGNVTGIAIGECTITCASVDNPTLSKTCKVTVSEQPVLKANSMSYDMSDYCNNNVYDLSCAPSTGNVNLLVIPVWFTNSSTYITNKDAVRNDIEAAYFGSEEETGWHSVKTFYEEESGGKLTLNGCVSSWYECGKSTSTYNYDSGSARTDYTAQLVESATNWYFNNNTSDSRSNYDSDKDGYLDGVIIIYGCPDYDALSGGSMYSNYGDNLWAYTYWLQDTSLKNTTNPGPNVYFWASYDFMYSSGTNAKNRTGKSTYGSGNTSYCSVDTHTYIHEMGHVFGLEDYYDYSGSYTPAGGFSMQDYNVGGHDPYSCLCLGWAEAYVPTDEGEIVLEPFQSSHQVIILTPSWNDKNSPFDEYLIIELYTPTGLNEFDTNYLYSTDSPEGPSSAGIRLWHVDSRLVKCSSTTGAASSSTFYNYPVTNCNFAMSNTYYSSSTADYVSILGRNYANYNLLQLIRNDTSETYKPTELIKTSSLFRNGSTFKMSTYKSQFYNSGKLNSGSDLGWEFSVAITGSNDSARATITLKKA